MFYYSMKHILLACTFNFQYHNKYVLVHPGHAFLLKLQAEKVCQQPAEHSHVFCINMSPCPELLVAEHKKAEVLWMYYPMFFAGISGPNFSRKFIIESSKIVSVFCLNFILCYYLFLPSSNSGIIITLKNVATTSFVSWSSPLPCLLSFLNFNLVGISFLKPYRPRKLTRDVDVHTLTEVSDCVLSDSIDKFEYSCDVNATLLIVYKSLGDFIFSLSQRCLYLSVIFFWAFRSILNLAMVLHDFLWLQATFTWPRSILASMASSSLEDGGIATSIIFFIARYSVFPSRYFRRIILLSRSFKSSMHLTFFSLRRWCHLFSFFCSASSQFFLS